MPQFAYDPRLDSLLSSIEATLIEGLPQAVRDLRVTEPCYALFIWYDDSSATDVTPRFAIGTLSMLKACAAQYPETTSRVDCIWRPQQTLDDHSLIKQHKLQSPDFASDCNSAYRLMLDANKSPLPLPDESELLLPFRSMLRRVAAALNDYDWNSSLTIDDSFVVVALDSIGYWLDDDLNATIPRSKREKLAKRHLLNG